MSLIDDITRTGKLFGIGLLIYMLAEATFTIMIGFEIQDHKRQVLRYLETFIAYTITYMLVTLFFHTMIESSIKRYFQMNIADSKNIANEHENSHHGININDITSHNRGYFLFLKHLISEFSVENLLFLTEIELFKQKFKTNCIDNVHVIGKRQISLSSLGSIFKRHDHETDIAEPEPQSDSMSSESISNPTTNTFNSKPSLDSTNDPKSEIARTNQFDNISTAVIQLPKRRYLPVTPIMLQKTFTATVSMMISVFISKNAPHEINVSFKCRKMFLQQPVVQKVLNGTFKQSALQSKHLHLFDVYEKEAYKFIKDSFNRFSSTPAFQRLAAQLQTKKLTN